VEGERKAAAFLSHFPSFDGEDRGSNLESTFRGRDYGVCIGIIQFFTDTDISPPVPNS